MDTTENTVNFKNAMIVGAGALGVAIFFGLWWLFFLSPTNPDGNLGWYLFAFATGLTMIVLPCTLPLAFVIVPLSLGKGLQRGLMIALSFGAGVALMLSVYGVLAAMIGAAAINQLGAPLEVVKNWVYFVAGIFAFLFALGEIGLIKVRMPSYTGAAPAFIQHQGDFIKAFLLGLFLGNIGVGCPHPATPLLLIEIASSGNITYGWTLFLTHAIGRIVPLILLSVLAILGVNGLNWLVARKDKIEKATGWAMVFVAGFILVLGLFSHAWWVASGSHTLLEKVTQEDRFLGVLKDKLESSVTHTHGVEETVGKTGLFGLPLGLGNWVLVLLWVFPLWWWWHREKKRIDSLPTDHQISEKEAARVKWRTQGEMFLVLSALLVAVFIWALPQWFTQQSSKDRDHMGDMTETHDKMMDNHEDGDHAQKGDYHEATSVTEGLSVEFLGGEAITAGASTTLTFSARVKPEDIPYDDLRLAHEKYMHIIGVRDDLQAGFFHIHPERVEAGVWSAPHTFVFGGLYKLYVDVSTVDGAHTFGQTPFEVSGDRGPVPAPIQFLKNVVIRNYQVALEHTPLLAGKDNTVRITVRDLYGGGVHLDNYLGTKMHLAVIGLNFSDYMHTHPEDHAEDSDHPHSFMPNPFTEVAYAHGEEEESGIEEPVNFIVHFKNAGVYKMFAQFRPEGDALPPNESIVAEFFVEVVNDDKEHAKQVTPVSSVVTHRGAGNSTTQKILLAVVSLALMAALSKFVYKKIQV